MEGGVPTEALVANVMVYYRSDKAAFPPIASTRLNRPANPSNNRLGHYAMIYETAAKAEIDQCTISAFKIFERPHAFEKHSFPELTTSATSPRKRHYAIGRLGN
jgi:hypothetical protein